MLEGSRPRLQRREIGTEGRVRPTGILSGQRFIRMQCSFGPVLAVPKDRQECVSLVSNIFQPESRANLPADVVGGYILLCAFHSVEATDDDSLMQSLSVA